MIENRLFLSWCVPLNDLVVLLLLWLLLWLFFLQHAASTVGQKYVMQLNTVLHNAYSIFVYSWKYHESTISTDQAKD